MRRGPAVEDAAHEDGVEQHAKLHVPHLLHKEGTAEVMLPRLRKHQQVGVHDPTDQDVDKCDKREDWVEAKENQGDDNVQSCARRTAPDAVVVLVFRLCLFYGPFFAQDRTEAQVLDNLDVACDAHAMRDPLHEHVIHVEVGCRGQRVGQDLKHRRRVVVDPLGPAHNRVADCVDEEDVHGQEGKVPFLDLQLGPGEGLQRIEILKDDHQDGWQEAHEQDEGHRGQHPVDHGR
mmetsp:Transcript_83931/g.237792  ORF Transcript_83931/g.237792 Transcript_83931/m.237792 type:complete len:233 (+) Transcript_83931:454-1152(+)